MSENKKRKERNCYSNHGFAMKEKNLKIKRLLYYNPSNRQVNKKIIEIN